MSLTVSGNSEPMGEVRLADAFASGPVEPGPAGGSLPSTTAPMIIAATMTAATDPTDRTANHRPVSRRASSVVDGKRRSAGTVTSARERR
jgi:hypothetical protein